MAAAFFVVGHHQKVELFAREINGNLTRMLTLRCYNLLEDSERVQAGNTANDVKRENCD